MRRVRCLCWVHIEHEFWVSRSNPSLNGQLHNPNPSDIDRTLNEDTDDKIRSYRPDNYNRPSNVISFVTVVTSTSGRLHCDLVCLLFLQDHRETDRFLVDSRVQFVQSHLVV